MLLERGNELQTLRLTVTIGDLRNRQQRSWGLILRMVASGASKRAQSNLEGYAYLLQSAYRSLSAGALED